MEAAFNEQKAGDFSKKFFKIDAVREIYDAPLYAMHETDGGGKKLEIWSATFAIFLFGNLARFFYLFSCRIPTLVPTTYFQFQSIVWLVSRGYLLFCTALSKLSISFQKGTCCLSCNVFVNPWLSFSDTFENKRNISYY